MNQPTQQPQAPPPPPPVRQLQTKSKQERPPSHKRKSRRPKQQYHGRKRKVRNELSAGGVAVRSERGQWLVALLKTEHKRGEVWVLPKGHVETAEQERISDAAKREVEEEAGISDLSVRDQLGVSRFTFQGEDALIRKTVHYFLMVTNQVKLVPQEEEAFIDAAWFPIDTAIETLEYDTDQDIVSKAKEKLTGQKTHSTRSRRGPKVHL